MEDKKYWVWLSLVPGLGYKGVEKLLKDYTLEELWKEGKDKLRDRDIKEKAERSYEIIQKEGIEVIDIYDKRYPPLLSRIYNPPIAIYVKGNLLTPNPVAVVGSRGVSDYGRRASIEISSALAKEGYTVVSGMAKGADTYAHKGALKAGGRTMAVLGTAIDETYPKENVDIRREIEVRGCTLSEYPPLCKTYSANFVARNRIISGMSMATIIVEAGRKSGSLITGNFALEQGRDVYSLPGEIYSSLSAGTNHLIKEGAIPLISIEYLMEQLKEIKY